MTKLPASQHNIKMECKNCEYLIERYGFCPVVLDWVLPAQNRVSWEERR